MVVLYSRLKSHSPFLVFVFDFIKNLCYNNYIKIKGVLSIMEKKEIYEHLMKGGNPQDLADDFMKELNEVDAEKKAAKANLISAAQKYLALVGYCFSYKEIEDMVNGITESISFLSDLTIPYNGKKFSIFDL